MVAFCVAVAFTFGVSAFCSMLEAMILSTTTAEVESLKRRVPRRGELLERFKAEMEETTSAILSLNTIANTFGATMSGVLAAREWGQGPITTYVVPVGMTVGILVLSEVLPKNIGVLYRPALQPVLVGPLTVVRRVMGPISWACRILVRLVTQRRSAVESHDEEIILLAEKSAKDGTLTAEESAMVANALSLDEVRVADIMTPRTVVTALDKSQSIREVFTTFKNLAFARMPVYDESIDHIVGLIRRRDLLKAKANDEDELSVAELMHEITFVPENATAAQCLRGFLKNHQQLSVVVDEFGSMGGVITMEDVIEHILGQEIFEKDDIAIDMRELAKRKQAAAARKTARSAQVQPGRTGTG